VTKIKNKHILRQLSTVTLEMNSRTRIILWGHLTTVPLGIENLATDAVTVVNGKAVPHRLQGHQISVL
jgi:hypothetical protein